MQYSKCSRYAIDWLNVFNVSDPDSIDLQPNISWPTEYCLNGWIYNKTHVTSSIVIDVSTLTSIQSMCSAHTVNSVTKISCVFLLINSSSSLIWFAIVTSIQQLDYQR